MNIRKQCYDLILNDFETYPVWEFALDEEGVDGQDEATVRPCLTGGLADPTRGIIVRARFTLADGSTMHGCLAPRSPPSTDIGMIQPIILTAAGQVLVWNGVIKPAPQQLAQDYAKLSREARDVFPLRFTSEVELASGPVMGTLNGFMYLELATETAHEVR